MHDVINSRASWNTTVLLSDQAIRELLFWADNLRRLNGVLFWPLVFVPSRVVAVFQTHLLLVAPPFFKFPLQFSIETGELLSLLSLLRGRNGCS